MKMSALFATVLVSSTLFAGCQALEDITVGAYLDCKDRYNDDASRAACEQGVQLASAEAAYASFRVEAREVEASVKKADNRCEEKYDWFKVGQRSACKGGVKFYKDRVLSKLKLT